MRLLHLMLFLVVLTSLSYAAHDKNESEDRIEEAQTKIDEAEDLLDSTETEYAEYWGMCPLVVEKWEEAEDLIGEANDFYDAAVDNFIFEYYTEAYVNATDAIIDADDALELLDEIPGEIYLCERKEQRENASALISEIADFKESVEDIVSPKMVCDDVEGNWTQAELKWTLGNTHFTGGDYEAAITALEEAKAYYETALLLSYNCTPPAPPPPEEPEAECNSTTDCADDEVCEEGDCVTVECECGYISNHICHDYECCEDSDCSAGMICEGNVCVEEEEEETEDILPPEEEPEGEEFCTLSILLLFGLFMFLKNW